MDESFVRKGERALDDFADLWYRRRLACIIVVIAMALPTIGFAVANFWGEGRLKQTVADLRKELNTTKQDRDSKAAQLAPFLAIANQRFESAPPDRRLDMLVERIEELTRTVKETAALLPTQQKLLSDEALARLQQKLDFAPVARIRIESINGDKKAFELAQQLAALFQSSGFSVVGINSVLSTVPVTGLRITLKESPNEALNGVIQELFRELGQEPVITINENLSDADIALLIGAAQ